MGKETTNNQNKNQLFLFIMYHNYHGTIKQRISNGELTGFEYVEEYNKIKPCLLLYFKTFPYVKPIRQHRFNEYEPIIKYYAK